MAEWTQEKIEAFIASEDLRYQNVELPFGQSTGGDDRSDTAAAVLGVDLPGRTLTDRTSSPESTSTPRLTRTASSSPPKNAASANC